jgi:hypothetical protein
MKYEVRCCCVPEKLLGWMEMDQEPRVGESYWFIAQAKPVSLFTGRPLEEREASYRFRMEFDFWSDPLSLRPPIPAFKADGLSIGDLQRCRKFTAWPGSYPKRSTGRS